jgi:hypothetical protein
MKNKSIIYFCFFTKILTLSHQITLKQILCFIERMMLMEELNDFGMPEGRLPLSNLI